MRGVAKWASRVAPFLAVFVVLTAVSAWADDPPQARAQPPGGLTAQIRLEPPGGLTAQARLHPPDGLTAEARIQPPAGGPIPDQPSLFDMIMFWLQSRLSVPHG